MPTSADPVEILAYALWNDGHADEAIAVLERQIALEKKLAESGPGLLPPADAPIEPLDTEPVALPALVPRAGSPNNQTIGPAAGTRPGGRALTVVATLPSAPAAVNDPRPGIINKSAQWSSPKPGRRLAWLLGLLLLLVGGAGLWASMDRGVTELAQPEIQETPSIEAAPAREAATATSAPATEAEPAVPAVRSAAEEPLDTPPAEAEPPVAAPAVAAKPRPRPEPEQPMTGAADPPPEEPVAAPARRAPAPPSTARQQPAEDARSARARRLAERREAAERYVARRRAEAERRAAAGQRGAAAPRPDQEGPSILLGGRGLPD